MMRHFIRLCAFALVAITGFSFVQSTSAQEAWPLTSSYDANFAVEWMETLYDRIEAEAVSAPGGSRLYAYAGVTLYEALLPGIPGNRSLSGQLNGLSNLPWPDETEVYDWPSVANAALETVLGGLMEGTSPETLQAFADLREVQIENRREEVSDEVIERSLEFGDELGKHLLEWAREDGLADIREMEPYELPSGDESLYVVTGRFTNPVEPYWGFLRPFALGYSDECAIWPNVTYSSDEDSTFYAQAMEVKEVGDNLTREQRDIAEWWVDTPGQTGTPAGHWVQIENQLVDQLDLTLDRAALMYAMVGMVLGDSFISCWSLKYQTLTPRPISYIQEHIDRRWESYIETPPFPEYPSGHSVVSAAAADMLTAVLGGVAFTDATHRERGMGERHFTSFEAAANEAAISRLYGGIHYRSAIENGMRQGRCIVERTLDNIILQPVSQGGE